MTEEPVPLVAKPALEPRPRKKTSAWWILGGCTLAMLIGVCVWGYPYYRKSRLMYEIDQEYGLAVSSGARPPNWVAPLLNWLGEPQASQVSQLFFEDLVMVRLNAEATSIPSDRLTWILKELARCPRLRRLELTLLHLTADDTQSIGRLAGLEKVAVVRCSLAPPHWEFLSGLTSLRELDLSDCEFADTDAGFLAPLSSLHSLNLSGTQVTDKALPELKKLRALRDLDLTGAQVTESACRELVETTPGLDITDD